MKKLKTIFVSLSRPSKVLITLILLVVFAFLCYIAMDFTPLTAQIGFRRAEKANLVGPSRILAEFRLEQFALGGETVIIAQSDEFDILYNHTHRQFNAYPKHQSSAIYSVSSKNPKIIKSWWFVNADAFPLHLVLLDRKPEAISAEIRFMIDGNPFNIYFRETANRVHDGFFYFPIMPSRSKEENALKELQTLCSSYESKDKPEVTVTFYGNDGQILSTETILPGPS